jgi:hypothetical protein
MTVEASNSNSSDSSVRDSPNVSDEKNDVILDIDPDPRVAAENENRRLFRMRPAEDGEPE